MGEKYNPKKAGHYDKSLDLVLPNIHRVFQSLSTCKTVQRAGELCGFPYRHRKTQQNSKQSDRG